MIIALIALGQKRTMRQRMIIHARVRGKRAVGSKQLLLPVVLSRGVIGGSVSRRTVGIMLLPVPVRLE